MGQSSVTPSSVEALIDAIKSGTQIIPRGGGTKPSLWASNDSTTLLDTRQLSGIVEYLPSEYTITVQAGTPLHEVVHALAENGQYLPFDPPFAEQGATIGGLVAAGLSGPGAYRYGPLKDFIIGVRFVDGVGNLVRGGGKVVKNAAGFDFPKLFNGSLGRMGILTEVSFKVFPEPRSYVTLQTSYQNYRDVLAILPKLKGYDLEGVEVDSHLNLLLRLGYQEPTMDARKAGLETLIGKPLTVILGDREKDSWKAIKAFAWSNEQQALFKVATHPDSAAQFLEALDKDAWTIHLTNGGKTLYLSGDESADGQQLAQTLEKQGLVGLQLRGPTSGHPLIGKTAQLPFIERIQRALDPDQRFLSYSPPKQEVAS